MTNDFRFKQFTIHQQQSAMKVTTDACLFGAVVAEWGAGKEILNALDIGSGTGLLSLMLAQKITSPVDAVEIDHDAAMEAAENFKASPWSKRLTLIHKGLNDFADEVIAAPVRVLTNRNNMYDLILSNPPFYEHDLRSRDQQKNAAKHDTHLTLEILISKAVDLLAPKGTLALLLPFHRFDHCIHIAQQNNLLVSKKILVRHTASHPYSRAILFFESEEKVLQSEEIIIKEDDKYTKRFTELLQDYYLNIGPDLK